MIQQALVSRRTPKSSCRTHPQSPASAKIPDRCVHQATNTPHTTPSTIHRPLPRGCYIIDALGARAVRPWAERGCQARRPPGAGGLPDASRANRSDARCDSLHGPFLLRAAGGWGLFVTGMAVQQPGSPRPESGRLAAPARAPTPCSYASALSLQTSPPRWPRSWPQVHWRLCLRRPRRTQRQHWKRTMASQLTRCGGRGCRSSARVGGAQAGLATLAQQAIPAD